MCAFVLALNHSVHPSIHSLRPWFTCSSTFQCIGSFMHPGRLNPPSSFSPTCGWTVLTQEGTLALGLVENLRSLPRHLKALEILRIYSMTSSGSHSSLPCLLQLVTWGQSGPLMGRSWRVGQSSLPGRFLCDVDQTACCLCTPGCPLTTGESCLSTTSSGLAGQFSL